MTPGEQQLALAEALVTFSDDPLGFVRWAFPWGEPGTFLENETGPDDWQEDTLLLIARDLKKTGKIRISTASGKGIGKAQPLDAVAITPEGERRWGDLRPGDRVFGGNGKPTRILARHSYDACPMMRVTFDDRSYVDVSTGHLWNVRGRHEIRNNLSTWRTLETQEIRRLGIKRSMGLTTARNWQIPIAGAVQMDRRETPLHPYFVGVWIGDGCKGSARYSKPSKAVADRVRSCGYRVTDEADGRAKYVVGIKALMTDPLFSLGSHERYIPDEYKFNDIEARRALLDGLLDTDGECSKQGGIGYSTSSERLAHDIIWLARSLGCKAMLHPTVHMPTYPGPDGEKLDGRPSYRVTISAPFNPFSHEERKAKYKPASQDRYLKRWIESIEPIEPADAMCITVEAEDGLYQTADFQVTHNSACVSWLILWAMMTAPHTRGVVTANTDTQLKTKTWPEVGKWFNLLMPALRDRFELAATSLSSKTKGAEKTWRIDAIPWSDKNSEAFAGLHNQGRRILVVFDEASAIADSIWETTDGIMSDKDTEVIWAAFGNPTRNTGFFRETFRRFRAMWTSQHIDSRDVKITDKVELAKLVTTYGEDDDYTRKFVKGEFPKADSSQFIPEGMIDAAVDRQPTHIPSDPIIFGLDVARFGDDKSVLCIRRGRDAKSFPWKEWQGANTMELAAYVAEEAQKFKPDAIFIDVSGGLGAGPADRLRQLGHRNIYDVNFGGKEQVVMLDDETRVRAFNPAAAMWLKLREWLNQGCIVDNRDLRGDLANRMYSLTTASNAYQMEGKDHMKARGIPSCDYADALALTFYMPILPRRVPGSIIDGVRVSNNPSGENVKSDYDPYLELR